MSHMCALIVVIFVVVIHKPPENTTACRSSYVTISCGYLNGPGFPVTWIINGTSFNEAALMNSALYQLNNPAMSLKYSLTVFLINGTTTFQCVVHSNRHDRIVNITSTRGTVTVIGMCMYNNYLVM